MGAALWRPLGAQQAALPVPDTAHATEWGTFELHKFMQPIGTERYAIVHDSAGTVTLTDAFEFTDRGSHVPLMTTLREAADGAPLHYAIKGNVSRESTVDAGADVAGPAATVRTDSTTRHLTSAEPAFPIEGYAPLAVQQALIRYWATHGRPGSVATFFGARVAVTARGSDTVTHGGQPTALTRYSIGGLIWGIETVWLDDSLRLVAAVTVDAEFDHFEGLRTGYEEDLGFFVRRAATDAMAVLAALSAGATPPAMDLTRPLAIVGADVIDATGSPTIPDATIVVQDGRIVAVGPRRKVKVPKHATVIDATGKTVLPGLWDMHAHYEQVEWGPIYLASGVTTVRDVGNELEFITAVRDALQSGHGVGPRLLMAGVIDGPGPKGLGIVRAATPDEGRARVDRYHEAGFQQIKIYSSVPLDVLTAICAEAHRFGMTVTGHIPDGLNAYQGVEAGMDQINHVQYIAPLMVASDPRPSSGQIPPALDTASAESRRTLAFLLEHHTVVDPTLSIFEWVYHPASTPYVDLEPGVAKVPPSMTSQLTHSGARPEIAAWASAQLALYMATVGTLHARGVPIVAGTDQTVPGYSLHRELELYVQAGFTPLEAIQAATIVPARIMHLNGELGTVTVGKRADLLIVDGHPLAHIADTRNVWRVVQGGRVYDPAPLWRSVGFTP
jgi:imidazolonepropionase-like amidohydrolase